MPVPLGSRGLKEPELQAFGLLDVEDVVQLDERPVPLDPFELWPPPLGTAAACAGIERR